MKNCVLSTKQIVENIIVLQNYLSVAEQDEKQRQWMVLRYPVIRWYF